MKLLFASTPALLHDLSAHVATDMNHMPMYKKLNRAAALQIGSILLIVCLIAIFYSPSLTHMPRSDQWAFLIDTIDNHTVLDTFKKSYSYNRTRAIVPSDTTLFRPLLFLILSLEKGIFGNHFRYIQAIGIILHIMVVLLLFIIMNQLRGILKINEIPKRDAIFTTLGILFIAFYALNFSFTEIIIWSHLHAYIVFHIFTLLSFILLLKYVSLPVGEPKYEWGIPLTVWILALFGSFTYELGQIFAALIGIFFFVQSKRIGVKRALFLSLFFFAVPIIYQTANFIDMNIHKGYFQTDVAAPIFVKQALSFKTIENAPRLFGYFVIHPFFPSLAKLSYTARIAINELNWNQGGPLTVPSILVFASWALFTTLGLISLRKNNLPKLNLIFLLLIFLYLAYFALILFGRINIRLRPDFDVIAKNTYYLYFPLGYLVIFTFILTGIVILNKSFMSNIFVRCAKYCLVLGIPIILFQSVTTIKRINAEFSKMSADFSPAIEAIQNFVDQNPGSKISFSITKSQGMAASQGIPFTTVLFRKYEDNKNPDYVVTLSDGMVNFIPANEYRTIYNVHESQEIAPTLVKVGYPNHLYIYNGKYSERPQK